MEDKFTWVPLYKELAVSLLKYRADRTPLVNWIYEDLGKVTTDTGKSLVAYLKTKDGSMISDIDPFSVFGIFNRSSWETRKELLIHFKNHFGLSSEVPTDFNGIPTVDPRHSFFFSWEDDNDKVIQDIWKLFEKVVNKEDVGEAFEQVIANGMPKYSLTMCLFWICPDGYLALDSRNRSYLDTFGLPSEYSIKNYAEYKELLSKVSEMMKNGTIPCTSFMEFSYTAWHTANNSPVVWMWNGDETTFKQDMIKAGSSAKGKVDFATMKSKDALYKAYQTAVGNTDVKIPYAYWDLITTVKVGDIIVVFKSQGKFGHMLYGWGRFTSGCTYVANEENPIQRNVEWHSPQPAKPVYEKKTNNTMFFHAVRGIEADNIIRLLRIDAAEPITPSLKNKDVHYWMFAPGENASKWDWCQEKSMMCIGWKELGDYRQYASIDEIEKKMQDVYAKPDANFMNDRLAVWEFLKVVKPGDIIYAKRGKTKIVGRGVVTGEYQYDAEQGLYPNLRSVKWTHAEEWDVPHDSVLKTLTDITKYPDYVANIENLFLPQANLQYWWLVAKPKIWRLGDMKLGEVQDYTLYNDNGNQRRLFQNFLNAKAGDLVIGYEATPTKQIVALLEVAKENDGQYIWFKKRETLGSPIDYATLKGLPELKDMEFFVNPNGSLFKLTEDEYSTIMEYVREENPLPVDIVVPSYTKKDFLNEVFASEKDYETMKSLLLRQKNLILQGAPGVGKTFAARRLAYSIMGEMDDERIEQVQFHQNYSYEDFMMGYKPNEEGGFELKSGLFYKFCKKAAADADNKPYFFIIDEINRGNLSKIFGELLMLIENDYRDKPIKLSYKDEQFSVPANLHIIGMMNTADRSLAMIDYALRRRFSFFEMKPGFDSDGFKAYQASLDNPQMNKLIKAIKELNKRIAEDASLGSGFSIGHSYFCNLEKYESLPLNEIVEYDIIPMLREYWFDNDDTYQAESRKLIEALS